MGKPISLSAALNAASKKSTALPPIPAAPKEPKPQARQVKPSRVGKKPIAGFFDPAVLRQLKQMALDQDSSIQDLMREALNDLFEKHNKKPIA
jgi:predicted GNAT superfamily acetyltransferase